MLQMKQTDVLKKLTEPEAQEALRRAREGIKLPDSIARLRQPSSIPSLTSILNLTWSSNILYLKFPIISWYSLIHYYSCNSIVSFHSPQLQCNSFFRASRDMICSCPLCRPKLSHGTEISCPSKELSEKSLVSIRVKPTINTRNVDIMTLKKFIDKELSNMSLKKFVDKETQTDGNPSAMRRLSPSLPSKGVIIDISSNDSDYLCLQLSYYTPSIFV